MTISSAFLMKIYEFRLRFHRSLFLRIQFNIAALLKTIACHQLGQEPLSEPVMVRLRTHIRVTRPWWRHQMETFSALLALCAGNSPASGEFPAQRPVTQRFDVFFDLCLDKRLRKQSWGWWFETLSRPWWRHCNGPQWVNTLMVEHSGYHSAYSNIFSSMIIFASLIESSLKYVLWGSDW